MFQYSMILWNSSDLVHLYYSIPDIKSKKYKVGKKEEGR